MAFCDEVEDINKSCDAANLNLVSGALAIRLEAFSCTKNVSNPFLLDEILVIDPDTGAYPLPASKYYPVKAEWYLNTAKPTYEVVEGTAKSDTYAHMIGNIVISNSETASGKLNIKGLNSNLWVIVSKLKGVVDEASTFHAYGTGNGLKFLVSPSSDEFGNRVVGMFRSIAGSEESSPNGVNYLDGTFANTNTLFNQRLDPVIIP